MLKALVIPADSNQPVVVKEYDPQDRKVYVEMIGLTPDDTLDFVSLGDSKHQIVIDDIGLYKAGPVVNVRACHLMCLTRGIPIENMLTPIVGNVAVLGFGFAGDETSVSEEVINTVKEIEESLKS